MKKTQIDRSRAPVFNFRKFIRRVEKAPAEQLEGERLMMFSLIVALKPKKILEIGTHWGGSAEIICAALDFLGEGIMSSLDPEPLIPADLVKKNAHRLTSIKGFSPGDIPAAIKHLGGNPDFIFIDGDHSYEGVKRDFEAALEIIERPGNILFHDSHYYKIADAIDEVVEAKAQMLQDAGTLTLEKASENRMENGRPVEWGGLRLVRVLNRDS